MIRVVIPRMRLEWRADSEHERQPMMRLFLSQNVSRTQVERSLPEELHRTQVVFDKVELQFEAATDTDDPAAASLEERIQHANINIDLWVRMTNLRGESCLNQSGSVRVPLHALLGGRGPPEGFHLVIPSWGDPNANGANRDSAIVNDKGTVWFDEGVQVTLPDGATRVAPLTAAAVEMHNQIEVLKADVAYRYCIATVRFFREHSYTWPNISDVNAFVYVLRLSDLWCSLFSLVFFHQHFFSTQLLTQVSKPRGPTSSMRLRWGSCARHGARLL